MLYDTYTDMWLQLETLTLSKCELQSVPDPTSELPPVDEEEDEDMLAACINIGMQNSNRSVNCTVLTVEVNRPCELGNKRQCREMIY